MENRHLKRIIASILVKDYMVVNSYGFQLHLPVSTLNETILRLQQMEIDEIVVLNISHSLNPGEDFDNLFPRGLLDKLHTPLAYGGGIYNSSQAERIIAAGCERIVISANHWSDKTSGKSIFVNLGEQAILVHLPVERIDGQVYIRGSRDNASQFITNFKSSCFGEIYLKFCNLDGNSQTNKNFFEECEAISALEGPLLVGGGITTYEQARSVLLNQKINGLVIGNWLNRQEMVIPRIKTDPLLKGHIRPMFGVR
jgi:imidazole glycerol-phosphate synthase subunit HisF